MSWITDFFSTAATSFDVLKGVVAIFTEPSLWIRIGLGVLGAALMIVGLFIMFRKPIAGAGKVGEVAALA